MRSSRKDPALHFAAPVARSRNSRMPGAVCLGARPAEWHSDLTQAQRRRNWRAVMNGDVRVIVGARSALFLPFSDLGLIVVDEEHDTAFKQEDGLIYHARDMAVVRARMESCPI